MSFLHKNGRSNIQLVKMGHRQVASDYYAFRSSPDQTPAEFLQSGYAAPLFPACNVNKDGKLQAGQIKVTDKLKKDCKRNQMKPSDVFTKMLMFSCQRSPIKRCTEVDRLIKMCSFECPICCYANTNLRLNELSINRLGNNIIKELADVAPLGWGGFKFEN